MSNLAQDLVDTAAKEGARTALRMDDAALTLRNLMVLAHHVGGTWSGMDAVGLADAVEDAAG